MAAMTEQMLIAFADGELDEIARRRAAARIAEDPQLAAAVERQKRLKERLSGRYDPILDEEVPERLRALLESDGNVVPFETPARRLRPRLKWLGAIAATFVAGFFAAQLIPVGTDPSRVEGGRLLAEGRLAEALETQLASSQPADAATRIGVSFAARDGRLCRTFESSDLAGLACRESGGWELVTTARPGGGGGQGEYRQAESGTALVMQASQELMAGEPFDAEAERRARDRGWRSAGEEPRNVDPR